MGRLVFAARPFLSDYGMALVLLLLCAFFGVVTCAEQHPTGVAAARQLARAIAADPEKPATAVIVSAKGTRTPCSPMELGRELEGRGVRVLATVRGQPADARRALDPARRGGGRVGILACNQVTSTWGVYDPLRRVSPRWPGPGSSSPRAMSGRTSSRPTTCSTSPTRSPNTSATWSATPQQQDEQRHRPANDATDTRRCSR